MPNWFPPHEVVAFASAARTATPTAVAVANTYNHPRALIFIDCTDSADTPSVVFNILTECVGADDYFEIIDSAAVTGAAETVMALGVGAEVTDLATVFPPGRRIQIAPVHADADSITYSVHVLFTN
jgi:hypothetical protein